MTDEQLIEHYNKMVELHGDDLPNMEQEPVRFAHYVKVYKYYHMETKSE